jgi:hypothetical protein
MCLALSIASDHKLPIIPQRDIPEGAMDSPTWPQEAQRFHTAILLPHPEVIRSHFTHPHVLYQAMKAAAGDKKRGQATLLSA